MNSTEKNSENEIVNEWKVYEQMKHELENLVPIDYENAINDITQELDI